MNKGGKMMENEMRRRGRFSALVTCIAVVFFMLTASQGVSAFTMSNSYFNIQTGSNGEISSLQLTGDSFPTNYVMNTTNAPQQNTSGHEWLGELMFTY